MKLTRVILSALALSAITAVSAFAQDGGNKGKGRGMQSPTEYVAMIDQEVGGLKAEQKAKITDIVTKTREQMQALPQEDRRTKGRELMQAQNDQVRAVLTAEQQKKFDEGVAARKAKGGKKKAE